MFTPDATHEPDHAQKLPIKVNYSNKGPVIHCKASAFSARLQLEPAQLDLGAILPATVGQKPNEAVLKLVNPSDADIEVGSTRGRLAPQPVAIWFLHRRVCSKGDWSLVRLLATVRTL